MSQHIFRECIKFTSLSCSLYQGSDSSLCGSDCSYIVVFQYGSIVLFNVPDNEIDGYLSLVKTHASGILPEMRKDGKICLTYHKSLHIRWLFTVHPDDKIIQN